MRRTASLLLMAALAAGAACGRGADVGTAAGRVGIAADDPSQRYLPVPPPSGGFGPLQVTPRTESTRTVSHPGPASSRDGDCWANPGLTEYTLSAPGGKPGGVAAAADGAVWFSDQ